MKDHHLDLNRLPNHVAVIMDGNGRWARKRLGNRIVGHEEGANSVREVARCCRELGIPYLTFYAFSKENWQRPKSEVDGLWYLLGKFLKSELAELIDKEIRICHLGDSEGIPQDVLEELHSVVAKTARCDKLVLSLALNYGGRQEIIRAARCFADDVRKGKYRPEDASMEVFSQYLFSAQLPDPDLIIRTGGEQRLSNFLLWQLAYAEIYITKVLWPDFREPEFLEALYDYQKRERRFGKTSEQLQADRLDSNEARS
ncbi:MAG: isoprenyl transferase [Syntrophobacteraceae bacterium]